MPQAPEGLWQVKRVQIPRSSKKILLGLIL